MLRGPTVLDFFWKVHPGKNDSDKKENWCDRYDHVQGAAFWRVRHLSATRRMRPLIRRGLVADNTWKITITKKTIATGDAHSG